MLIPYFPNSFSLADYYSIILDDNKDLNLTNLGFNSKYQFVNSASYGIYSLLRSFDLEPGSKVGLSPLICNTVTIAIFKAGFTPYYFDVNTDYVLEYNKQSFDKSNIRALILPHLYGALHPNTEEIVNWCKINKVCLINDTAQSFNLKYQNLPVVEMGDGGVYSFGFGKASSCAGGALVYKLKNRISYLKNPIITMIHNKQSKYKLASRTFGLDNYEKGSLSNRLNSYLAHFTANYNSGISRIQFNSLKKYLAHREEIQIKRNVNFLILKNNLEPKYFVIPESFSDSLKFKYIFSLNLDEKKSSEFVSNMRKNGIEIHNCSRTESVHTKDKRLPNYDKLKNKLFELSTEASIPEENFYRASEIMNNYFTDL